MINKEWRCQGCGKEFESAIGVCKGCGEKATRVFRTPVGISPKGMARRIDRLVESEFTRRNIVNYTNAGGTSKVTFAQGHSSGYGQPAITGGWGKDALMQYNQQYGTNFQLPQMSAPQPGQIVKAPITAPWAKQVPTDITAQ